MKRRVSAPVATLEELFAEAGPGLAYPPGPLTEGDVLRGSQHYAAWSRVREARGEVALAAGFELVEWLRWEWATYGV